MILERRTKGYYSTELSYIATRMNDGLPGQSQRELETYDNGTNTSTPAFSSFMFSCDLTLFNELADPGHDIRMAYPQGRYFCPGNSFWTPLDISLTKNTFGWNMTYQEVAFMTWFIHEILLKDNVVPPSRVWLQWTPYFMKVPFAVVAAGSFGSLWQSTVSRTTQSDRLAHSLESASNSH